MKKIIFLFIAMFSITLVFQAASWSYSPIDVIIAKHNGENSISRVYPVSVYQAWVITISVLQSMETNAIDTHYKENYVLTSIGPESCPCRTEVGVWVEPVSRNSAKVTIVTKGREHKNEFTDLRTFPDTIEPEFHKKFGQGVQTVKRGGKLPVIFRKE
jgi:hypothetical protein